MQRVPNSRLIHAQICSTQYALNHHGIENCIDILLRNMQHVCMVSSCHHVIMSKIWTSPLVLLLLLSSAAGVNCAYHYIARVWQLLLMRIDFIRQCQQGRSRGHWELLKLLLLHTFWNAHLCMFSIMIAYLKMFTEYSYIFLISYLGNDNGHTYLSTLYMQ